MTDVAIPEVAAVEPFRPAPVDSDLMTWVANAEKIEAIAVKLAGTSFVPASLRGKPMEIAAAMLAGMELGLPPMATLRSVDVIQGTPALRAHAMRGLVQSHGHEVELLESTPTLCRMRGRRQGTDVWQSVVWTIERARQMLLTDKAEWKKQPQTMLVARATGEICRLIASDVLYAMPYAAEELQTSVAVEQIAHRPRISAADIVGELPAPGQSGPSVAEVVEESEPLPESVTWPVVRQAGGGPWQPGVRREQAVDTRPVDEYDDALFSEGE